MKKKVGLIFGGQSAEHEVSINSARAVYKNIDNNKYDIIPIYINKSGKLSVQESDILDKKKPLSQDSLLSFLPWSNVLNEKLDCDIYFPVLHGPNGEDGKVQALIELSGYPLVGANSLSSALAMDKTTAKILFQSVGLKVVPSLSFDYNDSIDDIVLQVLEKLKLPVFIKPNSLGSSVGISKAKTRVEVVEGLKLAFKYDNRVIIEKGLSVREIEVSVMGNRDILVSKPGELKPANDFYDYEDKYKKGKTEFNIPASLDESTEKTIMNAAIKAYKSLYLNGMSRVDFFIELGTNDTYINEINTIPGFTEISMFPKLWETRNISFKNLLSKLIEYGFEDHKRIKNNL